MEVEYRALDEATVQDAVAVVRSRFGVGALAVLDKVLKNPLRRFCSDCGAIGYRDGRPVCFQATMLRRLYWGSREIFALVGGLTCKVKKGCPLSVLLTTIEHSSAPRHGSCMTFGNSCCQKTSDMNAICGLMGPASTAQFQWRAIRPLECASYFVRRKLLKREVPHWADYSTLESSGWQRSIGRFQMRRLMVIGPVFFDTLMEDYLKTNEGLVCSRTAEEVEWVFGERVRDGRVVILGCFEKDRPVGYAVVKCGKTAKRCILEDLFAVRNDEAILGTLMKAVCLFLKQQTPAMMLETTGFSSYATVILKRWLPHVRPVGYSQFSWGTNDEKMVAALRPIIDTPKSWFFGPYDGDLCF